MVLLAGRGGYHMARGRGAPRSAGWPSRSSSRGTRPQPNVHYALGTYIAPDDPDARRRGVPARAARRPRPLRRPCSRWPISRRGAATRPRRCPLAEKAVAPRPRRAGGAPRRWAARCSTWARRTTRSRELERARRAGPRERRACTSRSSRAYQRAGRTEDAERARARSSCGSTRPERGRGPPTRRRPDRTSEPCGRATP